MKTNNKKNAQEEKLDIKKFMEERKVEAETEYKETLKRCTLEKEDIQRQREQITAATNLPEDSGIVETLKSFNGKPVKILTMHKGSRVFENNEDNLNFDPTSLRILIHETLSTPLFGQDYVAAIVDTASGNVIYSNICPELGIAEQKAKILGRAAGLKECDTQEKYIDSHLAWEQDSLKQSLEAIDRIPEVIKRGEKLIYPQKQNEWETCVAYRMSDLYKGYELNDALNIMEALENGAEMKDVKPLISTGHSGNSYSMLCAIVREFSKRGVEFTKEYSDGYKYTMKNGTDEQKAEWENLLKTIEENNAKYEQELSSGSFGQQ